MRVIASIGVFVWCVLIGVSANSETVITRDETKAGNPVCHVDFLFEPKAVSAKCKSRSLRARLLPIAEKTVANLLISAWDDCRFEITIPGKSDSGDGTNINEMIVDGHSGIWWEDDSGKVIQLYERGDGCLEWEIVLDVKPASNRLYFSISHQNLLFHYQADLSVEEIAEGATRPDSVVGSYAVYHASRRNDWVIITESDTAREQYGTGKAFHVYRPKAHDAAGKTVWCELSIDTALTITVPEEFLATAVYPVTIDPTFGYSSAGASQTIPGTAKANISDDHSHLAGSGEMITSLTVYASSGSGTQSLGLAAYTMDNGVPKLPVTRLATAATVSLTGGTATWYTTATVSQSLTSGTRYCVALGDGNANTNIFYDAYGTVARSNNSTAALPSTWTNNGTGNVVYSMYATYTVSGSAVTPSRRRRTALALNPIMQKEDACNEAIHNPAGCGSDSDGGLLAVGPGGNGHCEQ